MTTTGAHPGLEHLLYEVKKVVVGQDHFLERVLVALLAGGHLLVVNFDPAANAAALTEFRNQYGLGLTIPIVGPYRGKLDNGGEQVELYMPDAPQPPGGPHPGFVPSVLVDIVNYSDTAPWPAGAVDGGGLSLQRQSAGLYGNEPLNWIASMPTPAATNGNGIVAPPVSVSSRPITSDSSSPEC